jgi:hypothetical protein
MGKSRSATTTSKVEYPEYVQNAQQGLVQGAVKGMQPFLDDPSYTLAPPTQDHNRITHGANNLMDYTFGTNFSEGAAQLDQRNERTIPVASSYAQMGMDDIMGFANPYARMMTDNAMERLDQGYDRNMAQIAADSATMGGGSGGALRQSMADRDRMRQSADIATQIASDSFGQGAQIAGQNMASRNASIDRTVGAMTNSDNYNLAVRDRADQFATNATNRNLASMGMLGSAADLNRQYYQGLADQDYTQFSRLAGFVPGMQGTQTQTQPVNNSGLLGTALSLGNLFLGGGGS